MEPVIADFAVREIKSNEAGKQLIFLYLRVESKNLYFKKKLCVIQKSFHFVPNSIITEAIIRKEHTFKIWAIIIKSNSYIRRRV